jgi:hypothetical protein
MPEIKEQVTFSVLLTLAVTLLSLGVSQIQSGNIGVGALLIVVGFGVLFMAVIAREKGFIEAVEKMIDEKVKEVRK